MIENNEKITVTTGTKVKTKNSIVATVVGSIDTKNTLYETCCAYLVCQGTHNDDALYLSIDQIESLLIGDEWISFDSAQQELVFNSDSP